MGDSSLNTAILEKLIDDAKTSGGSERGTYQTFINRLCEGLGLAPPDMNKEDRALNDYVYERRVTFNHADGSATSGFMDCYKRDCFILEAKQSPRRMRQPKQPDANQQSLPMDLKAKATKPIPKGWDQLMLAARKQAEDYARALPVDHGYPPFLLIIDIGHVIEVYADFSGQGKNYAHFPNRQSYRISMDCILEANTQQLLTKIWTDPHSLDPAKESARVTKDVAERLAVIAKYLEGKKYDAKDVAEFLMRCLFTMFAEDVGLIPDKGFENLLNMLKDTPQNFVPAMENLWKTMNGGGYESRLNTTLKEFNGGLFKNSRALPLEKDQITELYIASRREWKDVEPAIFGTLLERALNPRERSKLGAHYTPRAYVERLVIPTIIEPLRQDWQTAIDKAVDQQASGDVEGALQTVKDFHHDLCTTRVLDPACGTGNFLYVALELMKRLEGEVLEAIDMLGENQSRLLLEGETVSPKQFWGLELNPRAVPIAELVLWIGYLKWQLATSGLDSIQVPILHAYGTIKQQDAILAYDKQELLKDAQGKPLSRWDGISKKLHPITGEEIPDPDAQVELYKYVNAKTAIWPEAEFIVGNPPFIGNKRMIQRLSEEYVITLRAQYPKVPESVDFVMYWWWRASQEVLEGRSRRFGFVTTNKITQNFNRRVVEGFLSCQNNGYLAYAIPDHPWTDEETVAAVRVALSVGQKDSVKGVQFSLLGDAEEEPLELKKSEGFVTSRLSVSEFGTSPGKLMGNSFMAHQGVIPLGEGFRLEPPEAAQILKIADKYIEVIRPYRIGRDLLQRNQGLHIIDLFKKEWPEVLQYYPAVAQIVLDRVKPQRDQNRRAKRKERFWLFADSCEEMRTALNKVERYIATCRTAKHRILEFLDSAVVPDAKIVAISLAQADLLAVLSSRIHVEFSTWQGGWQGVGNDPVYQHSDTFNPFPFPQIDTKSALGERLRDLGERLDAFRKDRIAAHDFLTMTGLYNGLERLREIQNTCTVPPLSAAEKDLHQAGLISVLAQLHDDIDRAVLGAYGWDDLIPRLVGKPGATLPSEHKSEDQQSAEEELLKRLVDLNLARAADEKRGIIHWLRPDYQIPKLGKKAPARSDEQAVELDLNMAPTDTATKFPSSPFAQLLAVRKLVTASPAPVSSQTLATSFEGRNTPARKQRITKVLENLVATGSLRRKGDGDAARYFAVR